MQILLLGSSYLTSSILKRLLYLQDAQITVVDRKDPHFVLNQDVLSAVQALSNIVPNLRKNFEYSANSFKWTPTDSLSFLFLNPVTDSIKLSNELSQSSFDIVVDTAMLVDALYAEANIQDSTNINCVYPTAIFAILRNLSVLPKLYINLSSGIVYGNQLLHKLPYKEDEVIPNPVGARAGSLLARENLVSALAKASDIPYLTLRIGNPLGYYTPYENVANQIVKQQLLRQPIVLHGNGENARDFFDIDDLGTLVFTIISDTMELPLPSAPSHQTDVNNPKKRITGYTYIERVRDKVYNVGGAKTAKEGPITLITLDRLIQTALGKVEIPKDMGKITIKNSPTKNVQWRDSFEKDIRIQMNIDKAVNMLGYDPEYNILDTIKTKVIPYIATSFLNYDEEQIESLKKMMHL